jgi:hypothetical protein
MLTGILIGAAVLGGILKVGSRHISDKKERERLEREKAEDLAQLDKQWEIAQKEAFEQADKLKLEADRLKEDSIETDALTDITENIISQTFNAAIDDISMQEKQNATQLQNEMIGTEAGLANMEVASGASGVRAGSGTNSEVIAQQRDLAQRNREQEQIMIDQSFQNSLMQVGLGLQQDKINIRGNRLNANRAMENSLLLNENSNKLRASYSQGGDQYNLYYMKRNDLNTDYENAIKDTNFDWMEFGSDLLTGASAGYEFATNMINLGSSIKSPKASAK